MATAVSCASSDSKVHSPSGGAHSSHATRRHAGSATSPSAEERRYLFDVSLSTVKSVCMSLRTLTCVVLAMFCVVTAVVAFVPLDIAAMHSAEQSATQFSTIVAELMQQSVVPFFENANIYIEQLNDYIDFGLMDSSDNATTLRSMTAVTAKDGFIAMYALDDGLGFMTAHFNSFAPDAVVPTGMALNCIWWVGTEMFDYFTYNLSSYEPIPEVTLWPSGFRPGGFDQTKRPFWWLVRYRAAWFTSYVDAGRQWTNMIRANPIKDPKSNRTGIISIIVTSRDVARYLAKVQVAKTGRVALYDVRNHSFVAGNFIAPYVYNKSGNVTLTPLTAVEEPLIQRSVATLGESLYSCPTPCFLDYGDGAGRVYARVMNISDEFGLNMRLLVAIPSDDFLAEIRRGAKTSIGATVGAGVGLLIVGMLALIAIVRPLQTVEKRLQESRTLDGLDDGRLAFSYITEIRGIEEAFDKLQGELKKMRSFLPQSVLELVGDSSSTDDEVMNIVTTRPASLTLDDEARLSFSAENLPPPNMNVSPVMESEAAPRSKRSMRIRGAIQCSLNMEWVLSTRRVTVVITNIVGFHQLLLAVGPMELHRRHAELLSKTLETAKEHFGVIDNVLGDHFYMSWNAATHRKYHVSNAAKFVVRMQEWLRTTTLLDDSSNRNPFCVAEPVAPPTTLAARCGEDREKLKMKFGLATGSALCGNFGCDTLKQPNIIGPVVHQAFSLVHHCKAEKLVSLCNSEAAAVLRDEFAVLHWNYVALPQNPRASLISTVVGERAEEGCPAEHAELDTLNDGFEHFAAGHLTTAKDLLCRAPAESWMSQGLRAAVAMADAAIASSRTRCR